MKSLILLLVLIIFYTIETTAQRNSNGDRKSPGDRIDRVDDGNPKRNPDIQREPIQNPQREKEQQPIITYNPEPEIHQPICNPHSPVNLPDNNPHRPFYNPIPPIIIDTEPDLNELTLLEVLELGKLHLDSEEYNEAIKCFNHLLNDDPLDYEVLTLRGRSYHGLEFFEQAKKDFLRSIKIEKVYAEAYYYLGLTEIEMDEIEAAKVDFEIAAELGHEKAKYFMKKYFNK